MDAVEVHIGLGANVGGPIAQFSRALDQMLRRGLLLDPIQKSSLYRSAPWGPVSDQPYFINAVVRGETVSSPHDMLAGLKAIERDLGRGEQIVRWGPRLIDLDLLLYGKVVLNTPDLTIPHPSLTERAFALLPLLEISPDVRHPSTGLPLGHYLGLLGAEIAVTERIADTWP